MSEPKPSRWLAFTASLIVSIGLAAVVWWLFVPQPDDGSEAGTGAAWEESFRLYLLGGSTTRGVPFEPRCDFGRVVEILFDGELQGRPIELHNGGRPGAPVAYALKRGTRIPKVERRPEQAAVLIYSGNNEYARFDLDHDLATSDRRLLDVSLVDAETDARILADYERDLEELVVKLREAGLFVVLSTVATNLVDWEPNRSVLADPANAAAVERLVAEGEALEAAGELGDAEERYRALLELESSFAWGWWRLGQVLRAAGRPGEAREALIKARDSDHRPGGATTHTNAVVRKLAERHALPLIDAVALVERAAVDGLPGYDLFLDNCHPNLECMLMIAREWARILAERFGGVPRDDVDVPVLEEELDLTPEFLADCDHFMGRFFYGVSTYTFRPAERLERSRMFLDRALAQKGEDADVLFSRGILALFLERLGEFETYWARAWAADPELFDERLAREEVQSLLNGKGVEAPRFD